ncbi:hypothetical protein D3C87_91950 [compost metagenome]
MILNRYSVIILMILFALGACKKDLGNYSYNEINELTEIIGIPDEVSAVYEKPILIKPEAKFSLDPSFDEANYTYEWYYRGPNGLGGNKLFYLSSERNLDLVMKVVAGTYTAYYSITDKKSGVKYQKSFTLKVVNEINEGWMLMCDVNNKARVDMLSLNAAGNFDVVRDLLATTNSELTLDGKPAMIYTYSTGLLIGPDKISYGIYLGTDKGTTKVEPNTFKWTNTMRLSYEMYGAVPDGFYAQVIKQRSSWNSYLIGNNQSLYYYERTQNIYYSAPVSYVTAEQKEFKVAPFVAGDHAIVANAHAVFYDITNKRFVKHAGSAATCTPIPEPAVDKKLFSFSTGMDLAYMKWVSFNGGEVFAILKDPNSSKKYLARFKSLDNTQNYYSEIVGADFDKAEHYEVSPELGYIFYNVGSKVYEYDMILKSSKLMLDLAPKKISLLTFHEFKFTSKYKDSNKLMVASYDEALPEGENASLSVYTVPAVNGDLVLDKSYSGFGKVQSLTYRER